MKLEGQVAVIIGAAHGIGKAIVSKLLENGVKVGIIQTTKICCYHVNV